ncbi:MAG: hypothetical protein COA82_06350 [Alkaliphilus sp.]|nr:RidA family protein [bacterium AH-315-L21]MBN4069446.1 RidA family protein [bacterium AH-315-G05]PHS34849.1 MAG: hypothetical protein COA82_06350 [Alkaliphilus sp.]
MIKRYEGTGRMSRVVKHNNTIHLCGQTEGKFDTAELQTKSILKKIEDLLTKYSSDKKHILSVTIYLSDMSFLEEMNKVWDTWVVDGDIEKVVEALKKPKNLALQLNSLNNSSVSNFS